MTTTEGMTPDDIIAAGLSAAEQMREQIKMIEHARDTQPERLAKARADAETAADWSRIEEPFSQYVTELRAHTRDGDPASTTIALPSMQAKAMYGIRLAFDALDAGEDPDRLDEVKNRYFTMVGGDPGLAFLVFAEALETVASLVVPQLLDDLEQHGSNYDARVMLAEARVKAWSDRVGNHGQAFTDDDGGDE
ncbi:hypothetical protein [Mycolicibacter sinensis]|uniref:Uncharacterized protein n=1 Tax=Mycolicibacter sinensis (strain JDM601) TaxID=875328 RepID=A0A1A3U990_MYCSD|nr:hypothetical protein [Mycolicibacter sinensis]OBK91483.1 hypothetical protein A5648_14065 [Mycolicibacter sinensis]